VGPISYLERLRQLREELLRASDPAQRQELLEHMLFLVEAQSRARGMEASAGHSQSTAALDPQPSVIASPAAEGTSPAPSSETEPEDPA
jgi:hypothetical protein